MAKNEFEAEYNRLFLLLCKGVCFNVLDLGKMRHEVSAAYLRGEDMAAAMRAAVAKYRVK